MEERSRRLFFIQLMEDFFEDEDMQGVREFSGDEHQFEYLYIYLQLVLKSLATDGYLRKSTFYPYTPLTLRRKINFFSGRGVEADVELLNQALQDFAKLDLLYVQSDGTIFMRKVPELVMSKSESSQRVQEWRRKSELYKQEMLDEKKDPKMELEVFEDELFSGLIFINYARREEANQYRAIIANLLEEYENDKGKLAFAVQQFVERRKQYPFGKIVDRKNYFYKTISMMKTEIEIDPIEQFTVSEENMKKFIELAAVDWVDKNE